MKYYIRRWGNVLLIIAIIGVIMNIVGYYAFTDSKYLNSSTEERKEFDLNKENFEKHRKEYEAIKDCFIKEKIFSFDKCKSLNHINILNKLNLNSVFSHNDDSKEKNMLDIYFYKKSPKITRLPRGYIFTNDISNISKRVELSDKLSDEKGNQFYIVNSGSNQYKYTIIDKNWLIYEVIKTFQH